MADVAPGSPRGLVVALAAAYAAAGALVLVIFLASRVLERPPALFMIEPSESYPGVLWYAGFLATLAVLAWWTSAAACLVVSIALLRAGHARSAIPFLAAGAFSAVLTFDDALRLHEIFFPELVGIPELVIYVAYAAGFVGVLAALRPVLRPPAWPLLALAVALLGGSVVLDLLHLDMGDLAFAEEGLKLFGIVTWSTLFVWLSVTRLPRA